MKINHLNRIIVAVAATAIFLSCYGRNLVRSIIDIEGGAEILKKVQTKSSVYGAKNFSSTGEKIDFNFAVARGKHGFK